MKKLLFTGFMAMIMAIPTFARADTCPDLNTIIGTTLGTYDSSWDSETFTDTYPGKGTITGKGRCSSRGVENIWRENDYTFEQDHFQPTLPDSTGRYCYCQLDGWIPESGSSMSISTPWVFLYDGGGGATCDDGCAGNCAMNMWDYEEDSMAFRAAVLNSVFCPAQSGGNEQSGGNQQSGGGQYCCRRES